MDGAMGTQLQAAGSPLTLPSPPGVGGEGRVRGMQQGECYERWNLVYPDKVRAIHQSYVDAGAQVLLTNTFQANPPALAPHGLEQDLENFIQAALALARSVQGSPPFVLANLGPIDERTLSAPSAPSAPGANQAWLQRMAPFIWGADGVLLETVSDVNVFSVVEWLSQSHPWPDVPILLSFTFLHGEHGIRTRDDHTPEQVAARAHSSGVTALGVNCGRDINMDDIIEIIRRYHQATELPLFARPNAGTPKRMGEGWVYPHTAEKMARRLPELLDAGINLVGGCCGTTPQHIAAFRPVVDEWNNRHLSE